MAMRMVVACWPEPVFQKPIEQEFPSFDAKVVAGITPFCSASPHTTLRHENFSLVVGGWDCRDHGYDPFSSTSPLARMGSCGCHSGGRVAGCGTWQSVRLSCGDGPSHRHGDRLRVRLLWVPESFLAAIQRPHRLAARQYSWSHRHAARLDFDHGAPSEFQIPQPGTRHRTRPVGSPYGLRNHRRIRREFTTLGKPAKSRTP